MSWSVADFVAWEDVGEDVWIMDMRDAQVFRLLGAAATAWRSVQSDNELSPAEAEAVRPLLEAGFLMSNE